MFRVSIVGGPNAGVSYVLKEGENTIGRIEDNDIVLKSNRISKHHASIIVSGNRVAISDKGSSNGTYVNGEKIKQKPLRTRDRVTVGEYILEISPYIPGVSSVVGKDQLTGSVGTEFNTSGITAPDMSNPFGAPSAGGAQHQQGNVNMAGFDGHSQGNQNKSIFKKWKAMFDENVLPKIFAYNQIHEWRIILITIFGGFIFLNLVLSIWPIIDANKQAVIGEAKKRGKAMVHRIVEQNSGALFNDNYSKLTVDFATQDDGVVSAVIADMDGRILAPASLMNQYVSASTGGAQAIKSIEEFKAGQTRVLVKSVDSDHVGIAEPIMVFARDSGKNVPKAIAYVVFSTAELTLEAGEIGATYFETLITSAILGILILYIIYHLTVNPLRTVADELDLVLKGQASEIQKKYKFHEIAYLVDLINTVIQRSSLSQGGGGGSSSNQDVMAEANIHSMKALFSESKVGAIVLNSDKKVQSLNRTMEEISGIREKTSLNEDVSSIGRDEAFPRLLIDLVNKTAPGEEPSTDMFDFGGINYKITCAALGKPGSLVQAYIITAHKEEL